MGDKSVVVEAVFTVFAVSIFVLQSYEKILKLTIYKQKILKNFSSARLCCYISNSYGVLL